MNMLGVRCGRSSSSHSLRPPLRLAAPRHLANNFALGGIQSLLSTTPTESSLCNGVSVISSPDGAPRNVDQWRAYKDLNALRQRIL